MTPTTLLAVSCELEYQSIYLLFEAEEALKRIKEALDGNDTCGNSKRISNDIPTSKA